ncbi:DUF2490 domain-containing protein [Hyunsoonleella pacifica]|uniref:DUF2490 domain-containing protein n=1 Tax=Hyunsoonleella pacifica TaxID=1080224 RepID=A0A4Q9FND8_9FLAO|nr:DUF2490 domain-containing protein [Hyunsoonleella pacifica]
MLMYFRSKKRILLFFFLFLFNSSVKAQKANQFNSWWYYSGKYQLSKKINIRTLLSWARHDFAKNWQQSNVRIGGNYVVSKKVNFGVGYEWVVLFPYGEHPVLEKRPEHRIYEQITVKNKLNRISFRSSALLEHRIRKDITRHRLRVRLGMKTPIIRSNDGITKLGVSFFNEFFFNIDKYAGNNVYGQNRFYAGFDIPITTNFILGLGYLNQYISINERRKENNYTLMVGIFHKVDFRNKKLVQVK